VRCLETNECEEDKEWIVNIHAEITYRGHFDWGPNIPAAIIGAKYGGWYGLAANVAILLAKGAIGIYEFKRKWYDKANKYKDDLLKYGPMGICFGSK